MNTETSQQRLNRIFKLQKAAYLKDANPSAQVRIDRMKRIPDMLHKHREEILAALAIDFGGHSRDLGDLIEILGMFDRAEFNIHNVAKWMRPVYKAVNPVILGKSKAYVQYQPKGVVGNMVSWNFPFDIGLGPTLDALGAGNRVIIKPSDLSPECGRVLQAMISNAFDESELAVVNGDIELAKYFPSLAWDHLVYTGSGAIGKEVMRAAAANLVPVTLELGGKCPTIIDRDVVLDPLTIETVAGVKAIKRGQMCVSVDYCLVPEDSLHVFTRALTAYMNTHFSKNNGAEHACGIVSERHIARLNHLVKDARDSGAEVIQIGRDLLPGQRNMPFYLIVNPSNACAVMREEIFGPLLPIKTYRDTQDAIDQVNAGDRPLGLYVFSKDRKFIDEVTKNTHSGGVAVNTIGSQAAMPSMGFGGNGGSGIGRHHGEEGFREFSNPRGYFERLPGGVVDWVRPPYGEGTRKLIDEVAYASIGKKLKFALPQLVRNLFKNTM